MLGEKQHTTLWSPGNRDQTQPTVAEKLTWATEVLYGYKHNVCMTVASHSRIKVWGGV